MKRFVLLLVILLAVGPQTATAQIFTNQWGDVCHWESGEPWPWDALVTNIFWPDISSDTNLLGDDHYGGSGCSWVINGSNYTSPYGAYGPTDAGPQPLDWNALYDHFQVEWWARAADGSSTFPTRMTLLIDGVSWQSVAEADFTSEVDFTVFAGWQRYSVDVYPAYGNTMSNIRLVFSNTSGNILVDDIQIIVDNAIQPTVTPTTTPSPTPSPSPTPTRTPLPSLTPTPTNTANPALGTPTATSTPPATGTATATPTGAYTPESTPTGQPTGLPTKTLPTPRYAAPTSIPALSFGGIKTFSLTPIAAPNPLATVRLPTPYFEPYTSTISSGDTYTYTDSTGYTGFVGDMLAATIAMSQATAISDTGEIILVSAPSDYAPYMPRPMASVGYTIEHMEPTERYGLRQWATFAGLLVSMPVQLLKILFLLVAVMGPLGLFLTWLLLMAPIVLVFKLLAAIKDLIIKFINLLVTIFEFNMRLFVEAIKFVIGLFT